MTNRERAMNIYKQSALEAENPVIHWDMEKAIVWKDCGKEAVGSDSMHDFMEMDRMIFAGEAKKADAIYEEAKNLDENLGVYPVALFAGTLVTSDNREMILFSAVCVLEKSRTSWLVVRTDQYRLHPDTASFLRESYHISVNEDISFEECIKVIEGAGIPEVQVNGQICGISNIKNTSSRLKEIMGGQEFLEHPLVLPFLQEELSENTEKNRECQYTWDTVSEKDISSLLTVTRMDQMQYAAVLNILSGKGTMILEGPPGTGKSTVIEAVALNAAADGRTTIIIARKKEALEVIHKRLKNRGLLGLLMPVYGNERECKKALIAALKEVEVPDRSEIIPDLDGRLEEYERLLRMVKDMDKETGEIPSWIESYHDLQSTEDGGFTEHEVELMVQYGEKELENAFDTYELYLDSPFTFTQIPKMSSIQYEFARKTYQEYLDKRDSYLNRYAGIREMFGLGDTIPVAELEKMAERYKTLLSYLKVDEPKNVFPTIEELDVLSAACESMEEQFVYHKHRIKNKLVTVLAPFWKRGKITLDKVPLCIKYLKEFLTCMQREGITDGASAAAKMLEFVSQVNELKLLYHEYLRLQRRAADYMNCDTADEDQMAYLYENYWQLQGNRAYVERVQKYKRNGLFHLIERIYSQYGSDRTKWMSMCRKAVLQKRLSEYADRMITGERENVRYQLPELEQLLYGQAAIILKKLSNKKRTHMTSDLRRLMASDGRGITYNRIMKNYLPVLKKIFPIWLATPDMLIHLGIHEKFDYVFFDEASQLPVHEFLVSAYQAASENMVVCGDAAQLPPSRFFERAENDADCLLLPSALEESLALGFPQIHLGVHYRSPRQIIQLSNQLFYRNDLLAFSAPAGRADIELLEVEGIYDRGKTRTNEAEARTAIDYLRDHLSSETEEYRSVGILAMNTPQQKLIRSLMKREEELNLMMQKKGISLEILSIEMAQGNEFDLVLFSMGYGKDAAGRLPSHFGPLSQYGGERRLNVALSRAKKKMVLLSSFTQKDVRQLGGDSKGVETLKTVLTMLRQEEVHGEEKVMDEPPALTELYQRLQEYLPEGYVLKKGTGEITYVISKDTQNHGILLWQPGGGSKVISPDLPAVYQEKGWTSMQLVDLAELFYTGAEKMAEKLTGEIVKVDNLR